MDLSTDIVLNDGAPAFDWLLASDGQLLGDDGLRTAVLLSLFTDRQADPDDVLPAGDADRRGWWGDGYAEIEGDRIGSLLWLLHREKQTAQVLTRARAYAGDALRWLVHDGIASSVDVTAEYPRVGVLALQVEIARPSKGPVQYRFEQFWSGSNAL